MGWLQSPTGGAVQTDSQGDLSIAGLSTPQHQMPDDDYSTPTSDDSSGPLRFKNLNEIYYDTTEVD
jgi:hypothetical protein